MNQPTPSSESLSITHLLKVTPWVLVIFRAFHGDLSLIQSAAPPTKKHQPITAAFQRLLPLLSASSSQLPTLLPQDNSEDMAV